MLELNGLYKVFNAGTVNEKRAIGRSGPHPGGGGLCHGNRWQRRGKIHHPEPHCRGLSRRSRNHPPEWRGHYAASRAQTGQISGPGVPGPDDGNRSHHGIEENLALGQPPGQIPWTPPRYYQPGAELFRRSWPPWAWPGKPLWTSKVGLLSGGQRQALTLLWQP